MSLQAAFRKRLRKANPSLPFGPSPKDYQSGPRWNDFKPGGGSKKPVTPQIKPLPGTSPLGAPNEKTRKVNSREGKPRRRAGGKFKQVPADNPYAGGHRNVVAATMKAAVTKAVRMVAKHKDKRGSTAHHGKGKNIRTGERGLSVPEKHQLRIARQTMRMRPEMVAVMGGPDAKESEKIIERLTGRPYSGPRDAPKKETRRYAPSSQGGDLDVQDPREEGV